MLGIFKRKRGSQQEQQPEKSLPPAPGWDALENAFAALYPDQPPKWWEHDGFHRMQDRRNPPENPLEAVAIFDAGAFWHLVSFGMSDLFTKESIGEWSGFGYEFTFRVAKGDKGDSDDRPLWPVEVMVNLARAAYKGEVFASGQTIKTGAIDGRKGTPIAALLIAKDPSIPLLDTPHGKVTPLLLIGVEALEIGAEATLAEISVTNPRLVTKP